MPPKYPLGRRSEREATDITSDTLATASSAARRKTNHNAHNSLLISRPDKAARTVPRRPVTAILGCCSAAPDVELRALDLTSSFFETSDADEPVGGLDQPRDIGWRDPLSADRHQVFVGRLTGDRTSFSNVDGQVVLSCLGQQVADGWHADALQAVAHAGLE